MVWWDARVLVRGDLFDDDNLPENPGRCRRPWGELLAPRRPATFAADSHMDSSGDHAWMTDDIERAQAALGIPRPEPEPLTAAAGQV
jgi:hypothetical protein